MIAVGFSPHSLVPVWASPTDVFALGTALLARVTVLCALSASPNVPALYAPAPRSVLSPPRPHSIQPCRFTELNGLGSSSNTSPHGCSHAAVLAHLFFSCDWSQFTFSRYDGFLEGFCTGKRSVRWSIHESPPVDHLITQISCTLWYRAQG